jgi:hypothetical protein
MKRGIVFGLMFVFLMGVSFVSAEDDGCTFNLLTDYILVNSAFTTGQGSVTYLIQSGGVLSSGGGSNTIFIESEGKVESVGGSNIIYLKNGSSFNAGGGGDNTIYYESDANIINAGGGSILKECAEIKLIILCTDSDGGEDYYVQGKTCNNEGSCKIDFCSDSSDKYNLIEYICSIGGVINII